MSNHHDDNVTFQRSVLAIGHLDLKCPFTGKAAFAKFQTRRFS
jgi:hypothetical protein